jgi:urease beta subunit
MSSGGIRPGEIRSPQRDIVLSPGRQRRKISVTSTSTRPIRVSSHYPFWQVNPRLVFDRAAADGFRLDLPAGACLRWAPGESLEVELVAAEPAKPVTSADSCAGPEL